jgi:hypothetical protein
VERSAEQKVQGFGGAVMIIPEEVLSLVEQVSPENWGETYPKLFAALVEYGLTRVETELVLRGAAKRLGVSYAQVWADWQTYLGHDPKEAKPRASDHLRELLEMEEYEVWRVHGSEVWVSVRLNGHVEHWPVRSARTEAWLRRLYGQVYKRLVPKVAVEDVVADLRATGLLFGDVHPVFTRLGRWKEEETGERRVYLDLGRPDWTVVEVTPEGWRVIPASEAPVRFHRNEYQFPLPVPEKGGSLDPLWDLLPLHGERERLLVMGWLIGSLNPWGPYPVLILSGEKGAGKSTAGEILKRLLDPTKAPRRSEPENEGDIVIAAQNNHILLYDNLSQIPPRISDAFCRLSTGGGLSKRKLYTDDSEVVLEAQRPVILTGIGFGAIRDDLADRAIRVELSRIADEDRVTDSQLWTRFHREHPRILAALLDAVSVALWRFDEVEERLGFLPRLADWIVWAEAGVGRFGVPLGELREAFYDVQGEFDSEFLESNPLGGAILLLTRDWQPGESRRYTSKQLLEELEKVVFGGQVNTKNLMDWPKSPEALVRRLPRLQSALRSAGVVVSKERNLHLKQTVWVLQKKGEVKGVEEVEEEDVPEYEL